MKFNRRERFGLFGAAVLMASLLGGCADSGSSSDMGGGTVPAGPGAVGISQGGAQDFGLFRKILEAGQIPAPDTLDDLGFFAEHKLDYPSPSCGQNLCMYGLLAVMGNMISGASCTLIQIGMNSPIDIGSMMRPPLHLVLSVDTSGSMQGAPMDYVKAGLKEMVPTLKAGDKVSLVTYSTDAKVVLDYIDVSTESAQLNQAIDAIQAIGSTNLYDGLFKAFQLADKHLDPAYQNRVLYLSDGVATEGIVNGNKLTSLAKGYAQKGIGVTTIGVGKDFDVDVMRNISEVGAGNFYFLEDAAAVKEVFSDEVNTFLVPVALDAKFDVVVGSAYSIRGVYGTNGWEPAEGGGRISIPSLFLAGRTSASEPISEGRRGGGGAMLLELVPNPDAVGVADPFEVGRLLLEYKNPVNGMVMQQQTTIKAPNKPEEPPAGGHFTNDTVEKGFVMLNIYAGFKMAANLAADADPRTARRTLEALRGSVGTWVAANPDFDIQDDLKYIDLFIANLKNVENTVPQYTPAEPSNPWPVD